MSQTRLHSGLEALYESRDATLLESVLHHPDYVEFMGRHGISMPLKDLVTAFTHTSFAHEYGAPHQEQMEFLGDAVLQLILTEELCRRFPFEKEGKLSQLRSSLVNEKTLSSLSSALQLDQLILCGKGESKKGLTSLDSVKADTFEALLSQIYRHQGHDVARALVLKWYTTFLSNAFELSNLESFDVKSKLQEKSLAVYKKLPRYSSETKGDEFLIQLWINDEMVESGVYASKKTGEKDLAQKVLDKGII